MNEFIKKLKEAGFTGEVDNSNEVLDFYSHDSKGIRLGYDLLGNSVCVPVIKAVANRLLTQIYIHNHE